MDILKLYYKSIVWAIIIMIILFTPGNKIPHPSILNFANSDKLIHFVIFIILGYILLFETWAIKFRILNRQIVILAIVAIGFGAFTELIQQYFAYERQGSFFDLLADVAGICMAYAIFFAFRKAISRFYRPTF
jgi:VanZ family protein